MTTPDDNGFLMGGGTENGALLDWITAQDRNKLHDLQPGKIYAVVDPSLPPVIRTGRA